MCAGYARSETCDLPNLTRLAEGAMRFDRAYSSSPVCTPARCALWTGLPPQVAGAWCNDQAASPVYPMLGTIFAQAGYRVAYTGKWHLNGRENGMAAGGFPQEWWYDLHDHIAAIGPERHRALVRALNGRISPWQAVWRQRSFLWLLFVSACSSASPLSTVTSLSAPAGPSMPRAAGPCLGRPRAS